MNKKLLFNLTEDWFFCSHFLDRALAAKKAGYSIFVLSRQSLNKDRLKNYGLQFRCGNGADTADAYFTTGGNLAFSSGNGIDFSATSDSGNGTMSNELFDDYEEGSWTPSFNTSNSSGTLQNITYNIQEGRYIKIGSTVYVEGALRTTFVTVAGSAGTYDIAGLPFTNNSGGTYGVSGIIHCEAQFNWDNAPHHFSVMNNATYMRGRGGIRVGDASYTNGLTTDFNDGSGAKNRVYFSGVYSTDF